MVFTGQKHLAFLRRDEGHRRRIEAGGGEGAEGFVSIRSNGLSFFNVFTERVENQRTSASKEEREKNTKPTKAVKTFWSKCWC